MSKPGQPARGRKREELLRDSLVQKLLRLQEEERRRISAELHDGLAQNLLALDRRARQLQSDAALPAQFVDALGELTEEIRHTLEDVRRIARNLRPFQLDQLGLTRALESAARNASEASGMAVTAHIASVDGFLDPNRHIHVYRILQELIHNTIKHSNASRCEVSVAREGDSLVIQVEDDGCGFDPAAVSRHDGRAGLGLGGLMERIRLLDGKSTCDSQPHSGTRWLIEIPWHLPGLTPTSGPPASP